MKVVELLERAHRLGARFSVPEPGRIHVKAPAPLPDSIMRALRECKDEVLVLLDWPPPDAEELIARWRNLGHPKISISSGIAVTNLKTWFQPLSGSYAVKRDQIAKVRKFLMEYLPPDKRLEHDLVLERWRRDTIPVWRQKLADALAESDASAVDYAKWMLREVLKLPEKDEWDG